MIAVSTRTQQKSTKPKAETMSEQNTLSISELQQQANNGNMQAKQAIYGEMEKMWKHGHRLDVQTLLQLVKQQACEFSKDDVLEVCLSNRFDIGRGMGQSFTPNKIAELISVIAAIYNPKTVIDICCGTGNILSYFKSLQAVKGIDINTEIVQLAKYINPNADIVAADTLHYDFDGIKYDLVIGQPPFGLMAANRRNMEIDIINNGLELLDVNGVAIFIVSNQLLANSRLTEFRQQLLSNFALDMVISLPTGAFPHTYIKTSVLVVRNGKQNQEIFMATFEDNSTVLADNFKQHKGEFYLSTSKISDRLDRNHYLSLETIEEMLRGHQLIKLSKVSEIIRGRDLGRNTFISKGDYFCFNRKDRDGNNFIDNIPDERCVLRTDDIVVSLVGPNNKIHLYKDDGIKTVITPNYAIIRPAKNNKYICTYLQTEDGINLIQQQISRHLVGETMPHLTLSSLSNIDIPVLPLSELNELVSKSIELSNKTKFYLLKSSECLNNKDYNSARAYIDQAFEHADSEENQHKDVYLQNIDIAEEIEEKNKQLQEKEKDLEDMMSMFAHKFRSPLDAIIYNTTHENQVKLYTEAAQTMRGLLNIFSIISTDAEILKDKIKQDGVGSGRLTTVFSKTLDMILLHLLSVSGAEKIQQHYMAYAKAHGQCDAEVSYKTWCEDYFELEQVLQAEWEQSFALLLNQSATLEQRLVWLEQHFFKLELIGFGRDDIQFKEYGVTESLLTILLNEILVNAFKYYSSVSKQPVVLEWTEREGYQVLICRNPSVRSERTIIKGSHKGQAFLSTLARKTGSAFTKPTPQDDFVVEFGIPDELLISK